MEILSYEPDISPKLTSAYNDIIRGVPHCYPVNSEDFASALSVTIGNGQSHERLHSEAAFVA